MESVALETSFRHLIIFIFLTRKYTTYLRTIFFRRVAQRLAATGRCRQAMWASERFAIHYNSKANREPPRAPRATQ